MEEEMTRNLKALGLALLAVFAISAVSASAASAVTDHYTSPGFATSIVTGAQKEKNKFTVAGQAVECVTANFKATIKGESVEEIEKVEPTYTTCNYGALGATVDMNECTYTLSGVTDVNASAETHATVKVICGVGKHINITLSNGCDITVKEAAAANGTQTATNGVTYTNEEEETAEGKKKDVLIKLTPTVKVSHDWTGAGEEPLSCKNIIGTGKLTGTVTVTGYEDLAENKEGKIINILVD
jgi:hypothetical protein